jgi:tripartite-type tricarboxylate transporter receptor subunit TctC
MHRRHLLRGIAAAALTAAGAAARAQEQPIRIVFPFAAGGVGDVLGRIMAEHLRAAVHKPVIVENRTGAAGRLGVQVVKAAPPNGTMLLLTPIAPISVYPHFYPQLEYNPFTDLEPLSQLATFEFALAVAKRVPADSLRQLVAWLKANPSEQSFATPGTGTLPYFFALQFGKAAGLALAHASYRGSAAAVQDLVAGQIPLVVTSTSDLIEQHKAGLVRVLATSEKQPFIPDIPTFKEAGFDIKGNGWYAMYAPAKTPAAILEQYSQTLAAGVSAPDTRQRLIAMGLQPTGTTRARLAEIQKADSEFWRPLIIASGFKPQQ